MLGLLGAIDPDLLINRNVLNEKVKGELFSSLKSDFKIQNPTC